MTVSSRQPAGSALVAVIFLIAMLSFAAVAAIRVVAFDLDVASAKLNGFRARQLAEMGVAVGAHFAVERTDPLLSQWSAEAEEGFEVDLVSEGAAFNINALLMREDKTLLRGMFIEWGLSIDEAAAVVDALIDWVDNDDLEALQGAEFEWYESMGRINQPFNRPFYDLEEMRLVKGMDLVEAVRPDWRSWFTIWSSGALDLNEASAEMIAVAAEVSPEAAGVIPDTVTGADGIRGTEDDVPFQSAQDALALLGVDGSLRPDIVSRFGVNETTTRIESIGITAGARRKITLIVQNRTGRPTVLHRTEEVLP
jgi:type II secretory pathway component PulK